MTEIKKTNNAIQLRCGHFVIGINFHMNAAIDKKEDDVKNYEYRVSEFNVQEWVRFFTDMAILIKVLREMLHLG